MNREKSAWLISIMLVALLVFQIPGSLGQRDDDYAFVRTLVDIHRHVTGNYVEPVPDEKLREAAINGMLSELDPYTTYVPPARQAEFEKLLDGHFTGVGIQLHQLDDGTIEVITPIEGSPAVKAGILAGDVILRVNGEALRDQRLEDVVKRISGKAGTTVTLRVRHATGEEQEITITRAEVVVPTVKGYRRKLDNGWDYYACDDPKIAYIQVTQFTPDTADRLRDVLAGKDVQVGAQPLRGLLGEGMKGLILDLRFNPGGQLDEAGKVIDLFLEEGVMYTVRGRNRPERVARAEAEGTLPHFPMIVLVNEHSASAAEIVAGSLMENRRALVIGERTYGKGSVQEVIPLDSKAGKLKLTVAYYYLPSGRLVHRRKDAADWGVQPQVLIATDPATEKRILQERSNQDAFRRPKAPPAATTTTAPATTSAATQPQLGDPQLQQALSTMVGLVILQQGRAPSPLPAPSSATAPATRPAVFTPMGVPEDTLINPALPSTLPATAPSAAAAP